MSKIRIKSSAKTLPRGPGEIAIGWQYLHLSGTSVCATSDTLFKTSTNSGLVRRTISSIAIPSLFRTYSKVSIFRHGLRTSGSVEFLNVQFKAKFDICPSRFINQLDQLHQSKTFADIRITLGSGIMKKKLWRQGVAFRHSLYFTKDMLVTSIPRSLQQMPGLQLFGIALTLLGRIHNI